MIQVYRLGCQVPTHNLTSWVSNSRYDIGIYRYVDKYKKKKKSTKNIIAFMKIKCTVQVGRYAIFIINEANILSYGGGDFHFL